MDSNTEDSDDDNEDDENDIDEELFSNVHTFPKDVILNLNRLLGVLCAMPASFCLNRAWKGFFLWQELNIRVRHLYQIFPHCFRHVPF